MMTIISIVQGEANHDNEEDSMMMTIPNDNSIKKPSLRQRFEIMTNNERFHINNNITHILMPHNLEQQYQHLNRRTVCVNTFTIDQLGKQIVFFHSIHILSHSVQHFDHQAQYFIYIHQNHDT